MPLPILNAPTHKTTLPISKKEIIFRPFLVKEEKIMIIADSSDSSDDIESAIRQVIINCTLGKVDSDKLCQTDLEWLLLQVRGHSKGFNAELLFRCVNTIDKTDKDGNKFKGPCNFKNEIEVDLHTVDVIGGNETDIINLTDQIGMKMVLPSIKDISRMEKTDENEIDAALSVIMSSISMIYNNEEIWEASNLKKEELMSFLESLNSEQFEKIKAWVENKPRLELKVNFVCQKCGATDEIKVEGIENFFG